MFPLLLIYSSFGHLSDMRSLLLAILVSHLLTLSAGDNPCAVTSLDNCYNNVGFECGTDITTGDDVQPATSICCYDVFEGTELVGSGVVVCGTNGVYFPVPCERPLLCHTNFSACSHTCG